MNCPSCGHPNDAGNRFCEYCGARLEPVASQDPMQMGADNPADESYDAPTMFVPNSQAPSAPDSTLMTPAPNLAPTDAGTPPATPDSTLMTPAPNLDDPTASSASSGEVRCPTCGYVNQPGDRFCDQCGASLQTSSSEPASSDESASSESEPVAVAPSEEPAETPAAPDEQAPAEPVLEHAMPEPDEAPTVPTTDPTDVAVAEQPSAESIPVAEAPAGDDAPMPSGSQIASVDRTALETSLQEKRDELAGLEQMAGRYQGKSVPAYVSAGIDEVHQAIADLEKQLADLDAASLEPVKPEPDPAEVERLSNLIQEKRDELTGLEQMATRYEGKAVPAYVSAGMDEVRQALTDAENELARLRGGELSHDASAQASTVHAEPSEQVATGVSTPPAEPSAPADSAWNQQPPSASWNAPEPASAPAEAVAAAPPVSEPVAPPAPTPATVQPRFVVKADGAVINLPTDKTTIVIGREDPISGIFPEVDLTSHGGESGGVSRQHARMTLTDGTWQVEDLNSTNYTKVNGNKIAPHTLTTVNDGDQVQFGRVLMTFHAS